MSIGTKLITVVVCGVLVNNGHISSICCLTSCGLTNSNIKLKRSTRVILLQEDNSLGQPQEQNKQTHKKLNDLTKTEKAWIGFMD